MYDGIVVLLCGALVWSLLMIGCQFGMALSEAYDNRDRRDR